MHAASTASPFAFAGRHAAGTQRLYRELRHALSRLDDGVLRRSAVAGLKHLPKALWRRVKRLARTLGTLAFEIIKFAFALSAAVLYNRAGQFFREQFRLLHAKAGDTFVAVQRFLSDTFSAILRNPKENLPVFLAAMLGLLLGSVGLDGDGGLPDTDLALGIGHHRSIVTHSILIGAMVETALVMLVYLADDIHAARPSDHSPFWDHFKQYKTRLAAFASGTSLGIAYHLGMGVTIQGGKAYVDLPLSMPMEGHQILMGANAVAEGLHTAGARRQGRQTQRTR